MVRPTVVLAVNGTVAVPVVSRLTFELRLVLVTFLRSDGIMKAVVVVVVDRLERYVKSATVIVMFHFILLKLLVQ